jgi:hypothetical protein
MEHPADFTLVSLGARTEHSDMRAGPIARGAVRGFDSSGGRRACRQFRGSETGRDQLACEKIIVINHALWFSSSLVEHGPSVKIDKQYVQLVLDAGLLKDTGQFRQSLS